MQKLFFSPTPVTLNPGIRMFSLNCLNTILNFILINQKCTRKWSQEVCFALSLQLKDKAMVSESGIKMVESMVPISMAGMKNTWLKSLCGMSNVKVFADGQLNRTHYIDPHDTQMDKKKRKKKNANFNCWYWIRQSSYRTYKNISW